MVRMDKMAQMEQLELMGLTLQINQLGKNVKQAYLVVVENVIIRYSQASTVVKFITAIKKEIKVQMAEEVEMEEMEAMQALITLSPFSLIMDENKNWFLNLDNQDMPVQEEKVETLDVKVKVVVELVLRKKLCGVRNCHVVEQNVNMVEP